ncbi:MAG: hypothetical protein KAJ19_08430 [Gammaproteobacteria bacterium]|nr:hypothetical protein [Gammaproteobacteria bacterium]
MSDEEIAYAVAEEGSNLLSAVRIANAIAINFGRKADKAVGDLNITYSKQQENYLAIAKELKARGAISSGGIFSGGETISGKDSEKDDTDRVRPAFTKGAHDHPGGESKGDIDYTD